MTVSASPDLRILPAGPRDPVHPAITEALISDLVEQFYAKVQKDGSLSRLIGGLLGRLYCRVLSCYVASVFFDCVLDFFSVPDRFGPQLCHPFIHSYALTYLSHFITDVNLYRNPNGLQIKCAFPWLSSQCRISLEQIFLDPTSAQDFHERTCEHTDTARADVWARLVCS